MNYATPIAEPSRSPLRRLIWVGLAVVVVLWSLIAWGISALIGAGDAVLAQVTQYVPIDPQTLSWIAALVSGLAGVGQVLVLVVWLFGTLALLGFGAVAQSFVRAFVQSRTHVAANVGPPPAPGAVYDVRPERVSQE